MKLSQVDNEDLTKRVSELERQHSKSEVEKRGIEAQAESLIQKLKDEEERQGMQSANQQMLREAMDQLKRSQETLAEAKIIDGATLALFKKHQK